MVNFDVTVDPDDKSRIEGLVGPAETDRVVDLVVRAGGREALGYASGRAVFSTIAELRMFRVFCLLDAGMSLDESESLVATLFKLSPSGARRVVSSTLARYAYELRTPVDEAVRTRLEDATWRSDGARWEMRLPVGFVRERALDLCKTSDKPNPEPKRGEIWDLTHETYNWLRNQVGLANRSKP